MVFIGAPLSRKNLRNNNPGMGIDSMRVGGGRCPFLIVGGLLLVCVMLICNWWALTAENTELLRQIDELSEQLKYSVDERDKCVTRLNDVQEDLRKSKTETGFLHIQLDQQNELKKRNDELDDSLTMCKNELESLKKVDADEKDKLESLKEEKDAINFRLQSVKEENDKLKDDLDKMKDEMSKLKTSINAPSQKKPIHTAQLILSKVTNNAANEIMDGGNTDTYNQKDFKATDVDNAAEQI